MMACPYFSQLRKSKSSPVAPDKPLLQGQDKTLRKQDIPYGKYLQLEKLLDCQTPLSGSTGLTPIHDEYLFITTHQAFELWFKQILHEINSVRAIFMSEYLEERNSLTVISRINRVLAILKLCTEQFGILETMTSQDFLDFRDFLGSSSGFQSFQFRMMEIRLGVQDNLRINYKKEHFIETFFGDERQRLAEAMLEPTLLDLVNNWLARTPGLKSQTFDFWKKFKSSVEAMLNELKVIAEEENDQDIKELLTSQYEAKERLFNSIFDENLHNDLLKKNERRLSYNALQGALMIYLYRDEPRFHLPFQLLQSLMDIDNQLLKFRQNHASMVQRMVGCKSGTGGSSGYQYLRSTCSDRYSIFLDLLNLASYLIPRDRIPPLTPQMKVSLSIHDEDLRHPNATASEERDSGFTPGTPTHSNLLSIDEHTQSTNVGLQNGKKYETTV